LRKAATSPGTLTPFAPTLSDRPAGSTCTSRIARARNAPETSGITPALPCTDPKAPSTSIIARISAVSENSRAISASPNRPR
jgi:hypothetical protein